MSGHVEPFQASDLARLDGGLSGEAIEANKDLNHSHVREAEVVVDRVQLPIEGHRARAPSNRPER